jgi:hypothetical protein
VRAASRERICWLLDHASIIIDTTDPSSSWQVPGYPTWEIKGELYPGEKSIDQLEEIAKGDVAPPPAFLYSDDDDGKATPKAKAAAAAAVGGSGA